MKKIILSLAALTTVAMAGDADIAHPHDRIETKKNTSKEQLLKDIEHKEAELSKLKADLESQREKTIYDRFHFQGDLRLRYESIEMDDYKTAPGDKDVYHNRYRLRIGAVADLTDDLHFEFGMRSGFANPTSGNQTFKDDENLNDYFFQSLRVNVLGFVYKSDNSTYKIGRQPYIMYRPIKSQLVWDNDVSLNGANYQYEDNSHIITLGANQPTLEEKATEKADDVNLFIAQYVNKTKLESAKLNLGTGLYYYDGLKGNVPLFDGKRKGNTLDANGLYANNYHMVEGFAELQFKDVLGLPFKVAGGVVYNLAAENKNFGYDVAFQLGKADKVNDWQLKYSYTDLQEDATYGAYSDSDNFGGGTAARGHAIRTKYKFDNKTYLAGTWFFNDLYASNTSQGETSDYKRVQLDLIIKF